MLSFIPSTSALETWRTIMKSFLHRFTVFFLIFSLIPLFPGGNTYGRTETHQIVPGKEELDHPFSVARLQERQVPELGCCSFLKKIVRAVIPAPILDPIETVIEKTGKELGRVEEDISDALTEAREDVEDALTEAREDVEDETKRTYDRATDFFRRNGRKPY